MDLHINPREIFALLDDMDSALHYRLRFLVMDLLF